MRSFGAYFLDFPSSQSTFFYFFAVRVRRNAISTFASIQWRIKHSDTVEKLTLGQPDDQPVTLDPNAFSTFTKVQKFFFL